MNIKVSIVLSTYNRPKALKQVLLAFNFQHYKNFEVVVADDGSDDKTSIMLKDLQPKLNFPMSHIWQDDKGFRAAKSRNNALLKSTGEYIIFVDGDCIPSRKFIMEHMKLAEKGWLVRGSRVMLNKDLTLEVEAEKINLLHLSILSFMLFFIQKKIKRISPLFKIPMGKLRKLKQKKWQGVKTCNLGVWKKDLIDVNGFDERFEGWGHEDAELAVRLFNLGIRRKEGLYAVPVFHLWHEQSDRSCENINMGFLRDSISSAETRAKNGMIKYEAD